MEKKSNKGIIIALCTVIVVLIATITYLFVSGTVAFNVKEKKEENKTEQKEENKDNETEEKEEDNSPKQLSLDDPLVQKLYGHVTVETGYGEVREFFGKYGTITNETVTNEMKLRIALSIGKLGDKFKFVKSEEAPLTDMGEIRIYQVDTEVVINKINEIFGKDNGYEHISEYIMLPSGASTTYFCGSVEYNKSLNVYEMRVSGGCGGITTSAMYGKLISAEKTKDTIVLTEKIYFTSSSGKYTQVYKTADAIRPIESNIQAGTKDTRNNEEYFEKGATTKYTFRLVEDGSYYFESKVTE